MITKYWQGVGCGLFMYFILRYLLPSIAFSGMMVVMIPSCFSLLRRMLGADEEIVAICLTANKFKAACSEVSFCLVFGVFLACKKHPFTK